MDFKEIAAVSGKSGLFRILKPTRNGVVLEGLDDKKEKLVISSNTRVSILKDISMYTLSVEGNKPLIEIMQAVKATFANKLPVTAKSEDKELRSFFLKVVPDFDNERVYTSDIKKLVIWYSIIINTCPEVLDPQVEESAEEVKAAEPKPKAKAETASATDTEAKPKKAPAKKAAEVTDKAETEPAAKKEAKPKKVKA